MKRAILLASLGALLAAAPASAQYYGGGYGYGPGPGYDDYDRPRRRRDEWERRRDYDDGYGRRGGYSRRGGTCVTSRGNCPSYAPPGSSCGCSIPGFGPKRGIVY